MIMEEVTTIYHRALNACLFKIAKQDDDNRANTKDKRQRLPISHVHIGGSMTEATNFSCSLAVTFGLEGFHGQEEDKGFLFDQYLTMRKNRVNIGTLTINAYISNGTLLNMLTLIWTLLL